MPTLLAANSNFIIGLRLVGPLAARLRDAFVGRDLSLSLSLSLPLSLFLIVFAADETKIQIAHKRHGETEFPAFSYPVLMSAIRHQLCDYALL